MMPQKSSVCRNFGFCVVFGVTYHRSRAILPRVKATRAVTRPVSHGSVKICRVESDRVGPGRVGPGGIHSLTGRVGSDREFCKSHRLDQVGSGGSQSLAGRGRVRCRHLICIAGRVTQPDPNRSARFNPARELP